MVSAPEIHTGGYGFEFIFSQPSKITHNHSVHLADNITLLPSIILHTEEKCEAGWEIKNRAGPDSSGWTMVSPDQKLNCNGEVTKWRYQGKKSNPFRAIVWRPVGNSDTKFRIVGINKIPAGKVNGLVSYTVPKNERITVKAGDVIGWSFGASVLTYNGGGSHRVRWVGGNLHEGLKANQERNINGGVQKREYSIAAKVGEAGEPGE